jgi:PAS domain S-box-containing protein
VAPSIGEQRSGLDFSGIESSDLVRLHRFSFRLIRDCPLPESLDDVLQASMALLDADMGTVQLFDPANETLKIVAHRGFKKDFLDCFKTVREGGSSCGAALLRGERVIVEDVETDPLFAEARSVARAAGYRAVQSTPLRTSRGEFLGMLSTHFRQPHRPSEPQLRLLDLYVLQAERVIECKKAEEALRRTEHQLQTVANGSTVVLAHLGRDLRYKFVNKAYADRFNQTPDYYIGKSINDVLGDAAAQKLGPSVERVLSGESFESETEVNYPRLGRRIVRIGWSPEFDSRGQVVGWVNAVTDITDHALTECALRASEQRLKTALEAGRMGWWEFDVATRSLSCSSTLKENFGRNPNASFSYDDLTGSIHPDDVETWRATIEQAIARGTDFIVECRSRWPDGSIHWVVMRGSCTVDAAGRTTALSGISADISERKQAEEEVQRFRFAVENSTEFIGMSDLEGAPLFLNAAGREMVGIDNPEELRKVKVKDFFFPEDLSLVQQFFARVLREDSASVEIRFRHFKTGEALWMNYSVVALKERGRPSGFATISQNVTGRKQTEQELREARRRLQNYALELESKVEERTASLRQAVAQMEEFSYSVSHDLRAPIRAMNQYAKLLADEFAQPLGDRGLHYVNRIIRSSERMNQLTTDTLALSRITRTPVALSPVSLDTLVADIIGENPALQSPRAQIEVAAPLGMVAGNASLLTQAVANLLVNAAKFVPAGRIPHIRLWTEPVEDMARLYIKDNGIGVAPEHQHQLFGIFQRIHPAGAYDGTGIGLAIVRKAVERLGGQVGMDSDGTNGSTFWIQLQHP